MITTSELVPIIAILTEDKKFIPLWDEDVMWYDDEEVGPKYYLKSKSHYHYVKVTECVLNVNTKEITEGVILNHYPDITKLEFTIDTPVYAPVEFYGLRSCELEETKVIDILFEEFETQITQGKSMDEYYKKWFPEITFQSETIYCLRQWIPCYVLENGQKTRWDHQIYKKATK